LVPAGRFLPRKTKLKKRVLLESTGNHKGGRNGLAIQVSRGLAAALRERRIGCLDLLDLRLARASGTIQS
jgi:hypothetical protein